MKIFYKFDELENFLKAEEIISNQELTAKIIREKFEKFFQQKLE